MAELYTGIKFNVEFSSKDIPKHPQLEELKYWSQIFIETGLAPITNGFSNGNLSFRTIRGENQFIITGTQSVPAGLQLSELYVHVIKCDLATNSAIVRGLRKPSSETLLHFSIYKQRPEIQAIFHGHSQDILHCADSLGIPITRAEAPYGSIALVEKAIEISETQDLFILKNHGFISLGKNQKEAGEKSIQLLLMAKKENHDNKKKLNLTEFSSKYIFSMQCKLK